MTQETEEAAIREASRRSWSLAVAAVDEHPDAPHLMAGPHRRRVVPLGSPALVRHQIFWNPLDWGAYDPKKKPTPSDERDAQIDDVVACLYRKLLRMQRLGQVEGVTTNGLIEQGPGRCTTVLFSRFINTHTGNDARKPANTEADTHRTVKLLFNWHGAAVTLAFETHTEFVTLSTVIDCSGWKEPDDIAARREQDEWFDRLYGSLADLNDLASEDVETCSRLRTFLYDAVWTTFQAEILHVRGGRKDGFGRRIADFRGLIIGAHYPPAGSDKGDRTVPFSPPFSRVGDGAAQNLGDPPPAALPEKRFASLLRVINCGASVDTEITVSRFLKDRALYATALGEQSGLGQQFASAPLYYLVFENTANRWQLGRLVNRINFAGTYRVVAAMHFESLREVGGALLRAGTQLEKALGRTLADREGDEEAIKALRKLVLDDYMAVEAPLGELPSKDVDGPIYARIERSRFYVSQFRHLVSALRIQRVDGFQQYDEFVLQKIGPFYEYIDRLGRRYSQVQKDRSLLLRRLQALDALYEERVISKAQRVADIALLCILGPYYFGSLAGHVAEHLKPELEKMVWVLAAAFATLQVGWQVIIALQGRGMLPNNPRRRPAGLSKRLLIGFGACVLIMVGVVLLGRHLPREHPQEPPRPLKSATVNPIRAARSAPPPARPRSMPVQRKKGR